MLAIIVFDVNHPQDRNWKNMSRDDLINENRGISIRYTIL